MIKLTKTKSTAWAGNGFGCTSAEWVVKGHEHIVVEKREPCWVALDTSESIPNRFGFVGPTRIARAYTKKELVEKLSTML